MQAVAEGIRFTKEQVKASLCRSSFRDFVREFVGEVIKGEFRHNWHIDVVCDELQALAERVFKGEPRKEDLLINISPGTTKSTLISVLFPAWVWTRMPHAQFICASYTQIPLAMELSSKCRDVIKSEKYRRFFPEVAMREDSDAKGHFKNTLGGKRYAVGSKGNVTGMHADFIIIDDPLDPQRSLSAAEMYSINYWIKHTLPSRKTNKKTSVTIMVMQRLHPSDPSAEMLERKNVRHICLPATTEGEVKPVELADKYVDGLMDPEGLPKTFLDEQRGETGMGEAGFAGQYLQNPLPVGGGMFKTGMLRWGDPPPYDQFKKFVRAWDKAVTQGSSLTLQITRGAAFSVGVLMGIDVKGRTWILDIKRARLDSFNREELIKRCAVNDGKGVIIAVEQEGGSGGKDSAVGTARRLQGWRVRLVPASGSKEMRAEEFSVAVNAGLVYIPRQWRAEGESRWLGWAKTFVEEASHWPASQYLDQVDAASLGYNVLVGGGVRVGALKKKVV